MDQDILNFLLYTNDLDVESVICVLDSKSEDEETVCSLTENGSGNTSKEHPLYEISQINDRLFISYVSLLQLSDYLIFHDEPVLIIFPEFKEMQEKVLREQNATKLARHIWLIQVFPVIHS